MADRLVIRVDDHGFARKLDALGRTGFRRALIEATARVLKEAQAVAQTRAPTGTRGGGAHAPGTLKREGFEAAAPTLTRNGVGGVVRFSRRGFYGRFVEMGQGSGTRQPVQMMTAGRMLAEKRYPTLAEEAVGSAIDRAGLG